MTNWGSLAEWFSGLASIFTIILTIGYYNKDNSPKIYTRLLNRALAKNEDDSELTSSGNTLEIINAGKAPTKVRFEGLVSGYTTIERFHRWILYGMSRFSVRAWRKYQLKTHNVQIPSIDFLDNTDYILLNPFETLEPIPIKQEALTNMIYNCVSTSCSQQKQLMNDKKLKFHFIITDFTGKEYKQSILLKAEDNEYKRLKKKFKTINEK